MNLTAAYFLGIDRTFLRKKPFPPLVVSEYQDVFYLHIREVIRTPAAYMREFAA